MTTMNHDLEWNAGELGCGELVLELRMRMRQAPGKVFKLIALDASLTPESTKALILAGCQKNGRVNLVHAKQSIALLRQKLAAPR